VHPVVWQLGPFTIRSYGILISIAFAIGIWLAVRRGRTRGLDPSQMTDLCIVILVSSIAGARLLYVIPYWEEYAARPLRLLAVWEGGLTMYGGLLAAVLASIVFTRRKGMPFWTVSDVTAPSIALGLGLTRIGCFLNGCCFGLPTGLRWGVRFPPHSAAGAEFYGIPIHPTQLYAALGGFALFVGLLLVEKRIRGEGRLFLLLIMAYGVLRLVLDHFRFYEDVSVLALGSSSLSWNQWLSLGLIVAAGILYLRQGSHR